MDSYRSRAAHNERVRRKKQRKKHIRIFILILLLFIMAGVFLILSLVNKIDEIKNHPLEQISLNEGLSDPNMKDFTNIVVFGVDSRANALQENTRSDSIILVSINNKTHDVKLTSIFRDTYTRIDGHGYTKINHAYSYGGPDLAVNTINQNFDLDVQDFITVNFSALSNVIDALGGITLNIHKDERKWVNAYARDVAKINGTSYEKIKKPGKQTVSGVQATGYCRVRYTKGGDFTRAARQRRVMKALMTKAKHSSPLKLYRVLNEMLPQIYTSLTTQEILQLGMYLPFYDIKTSRGFPYKLDCHRASDGIYYDFPTTLTSNVTTLHKKLFDTKNYTPTKTVQEITAGMGY
jgi:LCP family protein required for cell wall assembly